ncbi:N-acyl-D-glucosamine 2-epimerase [Bacillus sp. TS-2]|nr:N-acyl-D-glucosamine 2-epimerase [Bacillus sp. TS-2]
MSQTMLNLNQLKVDIENELKNNILSFWETHTVDRIHGGFYGSVSNELDVKKKAEKGAILNSRILWTFSKAYRHFEELNYLAIAEHAFSYLKEVFLDLENNGLFWEVTYNGIPTETRKHIYNQAFAIYGLSEFYQATGKEESLEIAKGLFKVIEAKSYDPQNKGYYEAFKNNWDQDEDFRLSGKELKAEKTMNTHLHLLEAYCNLYRVWKDKLLKERLLELIEVFNEKILDKQHYQFHLFFNEKWQSKANVISFGHDIEGSWLLYEAAEVLEDKNILLRIRETSVKMVESVYENGIDSNGGVHNERINEKVDRDKIWWVQAEAMVGFLNAYQLTKNEKFLRALQQNWSFTKKFIIDHKHGEWFWKRRSDLSIDPDLQKVEPWKCPYHNARFGFEISERLNTLIRN